MFTKSSNLTKSFEGVRIEIETPVDFDTVMKRSIAESTVSEST